jgi:hypothetical protein
MKNRGHVTGSVHAMGQDDLATSRPCPVESAPKAHSITSSRSMKIRDLVTPGKPPN